MNCPTHNTRLIGQKTQYGVRFYCSVDGCTVACWSGSTSTPADEPTRKLRSQCHAKFDPLWYGKKKFANRNEAYRWLRRVMDLPREKAHIGMFDREQCERLLVIIAELS